VILRCTGKVLTVLGRTRAVRPGPAPDHEDWYANLLRIDRRQCLLLTHAGTLFTVFEPGITAARLRATSQLLTELIGRELRAESLPSDTFGDLGCMNDMAFRCEHTAHLDGGLAGLDVPALNHDLRRNINSTRGYQQPIDLTLARLHR
jgi:hypothetical protein